VAAIFLPPAAEKLNEFTDLTFLISWLEGLTYEAFSSLKHKKHSLKEATAKGISLGQIKSFGLPFDQCLTGDV
jgi:hypothetical protein